MRLDRVLSAPESALRHLERWCNDGSPSGLSFAAHQVSPPYRPREGAEAFPVASWRVPWNRVEVTMASPSETMVRTAVDLDGVVIALHPDDDRTLPGEPGPVLTVCPTASARTVIVVEPGPVRYLKLHYPGLLGRVPRELDRKRVRASVLMSAELDAMAEARLLAPTVAYLAESVGASCVFAKGSAGIVHREYAPRPILPGRGDTALIPMFSLFSTDLHAPDDPPLLVQLLGRWADPRQALCERILAPILDSYACLTFGAGLVPEDHAQNLLLETDHEGSPQRVVRRDLLDWYADLAIRRRRGLSTDFIRALDVDADAERGFGGRSYAFDFRLGEYILDPLIDCAAATFGFETEGVRDWVRHRVAGLAARHDVDLKEYFQPYDQVYRYERGMNIWRSGRPLFAMSNGPVYR